MWKRYRDGQSIAEYAVLLGLVIAAFVGMQVYARRGLQARVKSGTDALTSIASGPITEGAAAGGTGGVTTNFNALSQYEPYYQESSGDVYQESVKQSHMKDGSIKEEKVSDVTARKEGAYTRQRGIKDRATREGLFVPPATP